MKVWAPGRVNLIGEHTDYSGLPVLPIAIDRGITVTAERGPTFTATSTGYEGSVTIDSGAPAPAGWERYVWAVAVVLDGVGPTRITVDSDLPAAAGLSSSSALVVALIGALDRLWALELSAGRIIELASTAERGVGIEGGTMDQTVITSAQPGFATRIDFLPPQIDHIPLPTDISVVAAHCGVAAPKTGPVRDAYDRLVVGSRCAAALLGNRSGGDVGNARLLGELSLEEVAVDTLPDSATPREVARTASRPVGELVELASRRLDPDQPVRIRSVARHALSEAGRVDQAADALRHGDIHELGALLSESHASLQDIGVSIGALDDTVDALRAAGATGARLTGAGFGGYCIAAVAREDARSVVSEFDDAFIVEATGGMVR